MPTAHPPVRKHGPPARVTTRTATATRPPPSRLCRLAAKLQRLFAQPNRSMTYVACGKCYCNLVRLMWAAGARKPAAARPWLACTPQHSSAAACPQRVHAHEIMLQRKIPGSDDPSGRHPWNYLPCPQEQQQHMAGRTRSPARWWPPTDWHSADRDVNRRNTGCCMTHRTSLLNSHQRNSEASRSQT